MRGIRSKEIGRGEDKFVGKIAPKDMGKHMP
jgi:hypothetical protein